MTAMIGVEFSINMCPRVNWHDDNRLLGPFKRMIFIIFYINGLVPTTPQGTFHFPSENDFTPISYYLNKVEQRFFSSKGRGRAAGENNSA